jgi:hypothetical protein
MSTLDCAVIAACLAWTMNGPNRHGQAEYRITSPLYRGEAAAHRGHIRRSAGQAGTEITLTSAAAEPYVSRGAQMAELVDALVSGTSGESRGGSSPLLGTNHMDSAISG